MMAEYDPGFNPFDVPKRKSPAQVDREAKRRMASELKGAAVGGFATATALEKNARNRQLTWMDVISLWTFYLIIVAIGPVTQTIVWWDYQSTKLLNSPAAKFLGIASQVEVNAEIGKGEKKIKKGEIVGGFPVTSPRGRRDIGAGGEMHHGVDLATPVGTPLYLPTTTQVKCWNDDGGGGLVGEFDFGGHSHKFLHLSDCIPGVIGQGQVFGKTGGQPGASGAGRTTGPHLDYRMKSRGAWKEPSRRLLTAVLENTEISSGVTDVTAFIKELEQFRETPYWDYAQYSWGYGTRAPGPAGTISREQAEEELNNYLEQHCYPLVEPLGLNTNQAIAVNSLCYNIGPDAFESSEMYKQLSRGSLNQAANEFDRWVNADGARLEGLVKRRQQEKALFLNK